MPALNFNLQTDTGDWLSLSSLRGKRVVLYFYPKDDTPGCTQESCELRDLFPRFAASDAVVLGVSPDDVESHRNFKAKFNLPFTLLVDGGHALAEQLGLWVEKQFMGRRYMGVQRTTYILGPDGAVQYVFEKVNPAGHAQEVMAFLRGGPEAAAAARAAFDAGTKPAAGKSAARKPAKKPAKKPAAKKATKKAAKKPAKKPVKKAVRKPAKKAVRKPVKKTPAKRAAKAGRKPAKRPAAKK
ncbi:MAG: redoxin domain-containing protein [Gemmatimonadetes bacterium]|nr:redoxin domain-containing protein [Gemmatimonadota bacterium]